MGSFFSSLVTTPLADASSAGGDSAVVAVNSTADWERHWSSLTQTPNKLKRWRSTSPPPGAVPDFKALASKYADAAFVKIDVDELSEVSRRWNVSSMPTFVLAKGEKEVARVVGARKDELEARIQQHVAFRVI